MAEDSGLEPHTFRYSQFSKLDQRARLVYLPHGGRRATRTLKAIKPSRFQGGVLIQPDSFHIWYARQDSNLHAFWTRRLKLRASAVPPLALIGTEGEIRTLTPYGQQVLNLSRLPLRHPCLLVQKEGLEPSRVAPRGFEPRMSTISSFLHWCGGLDSNQLCFFKCARFTVQCDSAIFAATAY